MKEFDDIMEIVFQAIRLSILVDLIAEKLLKVCQKDIENK